MRRQVLPTAPSPIHTHFTFLIAMVTLLGSSDLHVIPRGTGPVSYLHVTYLLTSNTYLCAGSVCKVVALSKQVSMKHQQKQSIIMVICIISNF